MLSGTVIALGNSGQPRTKLDFLDLLRSYGGLLRILMLFLSQAWTAYTLGSRDGTERYIITISWTLLRGGRLVSREQTVE